MENETATVKNTRAGLETGAHPGNKKNVLIITAIAVVVGMVLLLGGYAWFKSVKNAESPDDSNQKAVQEATRGVLPSVSNNPLEGRPNLNPVDSTNPITEIKINPFE